MRGLARYAARLRASLDRPVPDADPADGGTDASLLLLLERPGRAVGRGFVSRDNATPTARNIGRFSRLAGLERRDTLIWNVVPWLDAGASRDVAPRRGEIETGLSLLPDLLDLMPRLSVVVLAGRVAGLARPTVERARPSVTVLAMPHPSPTIVCTDPRIAASIGACLERAAWLLRQTS